MERTLAAFQRYNWHVAITGTAEDHGIAAPLATDPFAGGTSKRPSVAIALTEASREATRQAGITTLSHLPGRDVVAFLDAPSLFQPDEGDERGTPAGLAARRLAARLPYTFAGTRVAVQTFFDHLEAGYTIEGFLEQFPTVRRAQVVRLLDTLRKDAERDAVPA